MNATVQQPPVSDEMSSVFINSLVHYYNFVFHDLSDPRTRDWFLLPSPLPGLTLMGLYLYFSLSWGPKQMEHRKPFRLNTVLVVYNFLQVLLSIYLFYEAADAAWFNHYSWKCQPVDPATSPQALRIARAVYIYFLSKLTELLDTVFFVLRKKQKQITFLHLYHHTVMPMISWGAAKYYPGGHGTFIGFINCFVHIVMYSYYMLAALFSNKPEYLKYLWWKKYITTLQMSQFCVAFLHSFQLVFFDCGYPRWSVFFVLPNAIFFYLLFASFYNSAYKPDASRKQANGHAAQPSGTGNGKGKLE